jgi:hypothetical protein
MARAEARQQVGQSRSTAFPSVDCGEAMVAGPLESEDRPTIDVSSSIATTSDADGHTVMSTPASAPPPGSFPFELLVVSEMNRPVLYGPPTEVSHVRIETEGAHTPGPFDVEALSPLEHESMRLGDERHEHTLQTCLKVCWVFITQDYYIIYCGMPCPILERLG